MDSRKLITSKDAAAILGFTPDYIRRLCIDKKIIAEKIGNNWVMEKKAIKHIKRVRHKKEL